MKPVTQTRTGFPAGNCTEATLATILECDIEDVPQLWCGRMDVQTGREAQPPERIKALLRWLEEKHAKAWVEWSFVENIGTSVPLRLPVHTDCYDVIREWIDPSEPHTLSGPNPDGIQHLVVAVNGRIVWDPNPLRRGLTGWTHIGGLVPVEVARREGWLASMVAA